MKSVKDLDFKIEKKANRLELLIRWFFFIVYILVFSVIGFIAVIALLCQFFFILFNGERHERITKFFGNYVNHIAKVNAYLMCITDEHPPLWPEKL